MIKFLYVNDDWEQLWIDGEIAAEGHSLSPSDILIALTDFISGEKPVISQVYSCIYCNIDLGDDWSEDNFICEECSKETI